MCGLVKPVACSHLISRSAYDHVDDGVTSPILVGDGYVMPTDRQIQDYLLCDGCEDILSKGRESWFAPMIGWPDRRFALWDMLKAGGGFHAADEGEPSTKTVSFLALPAVRVRFPPACSVKMG
jgi:hypothetical protein